MKTTHKILGWIGIFLIIAFSSVIGKLVGKFTTEQFYEGKRDAKLDSLLMRISDQINQNLPTMVDAETQLDSTGGMNRTMFYKYTMVNYLAEEIDVLEFTNAMKPRADRGQGQLRAPRWPGTADSG